MNTKLVVWGGGDLNILFQCLYLFSEWRLWGLCAWCLLDNDFGFQKLMLSSNYAALPNCHLWCPSVTSFCRHRTSWHSCAPCSTWSSSSRPSRTTCTPWQRRSSVCATRMNRSNATRRRRSGAAGCGGSVYVWILVNLHNAYEQKKCHKMEKVRCC